MELYPLTFKPRLVEKIWGGRRLETVLGKALPPAEPVGESWELYDFPPGVIEGEDGWVSSVVSQGPLAGRTLHQILEKEERAVMGKVPLLQSKHGGQFPLLFKYLDARDDLSIQVHPDQKYAASHPGAYLKNEAWYVVASEPESVLYKDLVPGVTRAAFDEALRAGSVEKLVRQLPVKEGDCHYLRSGTVHALGAGILAAEVQTPSDTTYRVFDFNRVDSHTGQKRKLHIEQALECIDFSAEPEPPTARNHTGSYFTTVTRLVSCDFFTWDKVRMGMGVEMPVAGGQPVIWMILAGRVELRAGGTSVHVGPGDTVLLPAEMGKTIVKAETDAVWLETAIPH